jgi:hypothetical protein
MAQVHFSRKNKIFAKSHCAKTVPNRIGTRIISPRSAAKTSVTTQDKERGTRGRGQSCSARLSQ